jgi:hypothetical protein
MDFSRWWRSPLSSAFGSAGISHRVDAAAAQAWR